MILFTPRYIVGMGLPGGSVWPGRYALLRVFGWEEGPGQRRVPMRAKGFYIAIILAAWSGLGRCSLGSILWRHCTTQQSSEQGRSCTAAG